jgi:hypothetical protein
MNQLNMKPATKEQIRAINSVLAKSGLMDDKKSIIKEATLNRTEHSSELQFEEAKTLLKSLLSGTLIKQPKNKMISKIFAIAHEMGWIKKQTIVDAAGMKTYNDYSPVYNWVKKYGYLKKDLAQYKYNEIPKLLTQFEQGPYQHYLKNL